MAAAVGWTLKLIPRRLEKSLLLGLAALFVLVFCAAPLLRLLAEIPAAGFSAFDVLADARPWLLLLRSVLIAACVMTGALLIGVPMGFVIARTDAWGRAALWLLHAFPMFLPPFLLALGWFEIFGRGGLLGGESAARLLFSELGLVTILISTFAPAASSLVALALIGIDASLEEAARTIARPWRVATRILLPAIRPAIVLAAIIVFALAISELGVPMFLRVDVFPAAVFARLGGMSYAPGEAFALVLPLLPIAVGLLALERRLAGARAFSVAGLRGMSRAPLPLGRWRVPITVGVWLLVLIGALPLLAIALQAVAKGGLQGLSQWMGRAPLTSVMTAVLAATLICFAGVVVGHGVARRVRGATLLEAIAMLAFVTPASVLGVGLISTWTTSMTRAVYGTVLILVIGYIARYAIVGFRATTAIMLQSPVHMEEAAAVAGAGFWRRLTRIVVPANLEQLVAVWLLVMVFCLRDLEMAVLFYPPGGEPLPVRIFTLEANGPAGVVAALALTHVVITAGVLSAGLLIVVRGKSK